MRRGFLIEGLALGFSIAAPVGPIGILCVRRTLSGGRWRGLCAGLGAATADAAYGCVAAFGLTTVSGFLARRAFWLGLGGGLFLMYLGVRTFLSRPAARAAPADSDRPASIYASTLALTLMNPATILSFAAAFAALGLGTSGDYPSAALMVLGVFLGSAGWWVILSGVVGTLRSRVNEGWTRAVNRASGVLLVLFGIFALSRI
jgi:threonine/homoserine/homoserine lactone efflux protein